MSKDDPDNRATAEAAATLKLCLQSEGNHITQSTAYRITHQVICAWIRNSVHHWAVRRGRPGFGSPDAQTVGFAMAALPSIADKLPDFPWGKTMGELTREDAALLFAVGHEAIEATFINTLEDQDEPEGVPA